MDTKSKNEFAEKAMEIMNEEYLEYQPGSPTIELGDFDKDGNRLFIDSDGGKFNAEEMIAWFNITMHEFKTFGEEIPKRMQEILDEGRTEGFITDATPTTW